MQMKVAPFDQSNWRFFACDYLHVTKIAILVHRQNKDTLEQEKQGTYMLCLHTCFMLLDKWHLATKIQEKT